MKKFLVVGTDGQIEQTSTYAAEDVRTLRERILEEIRTGNDYGEWEPHSYVIYEIVGRVSDIDVDTVEAAFAVRLTRAREEARKRRETEERQNYERLRKKFEGT